MTWSPFFSEVTPGPTSTTTPAPSWPRIAGKIPSGSAPLRVNASVWQMPVALISTRTSPARGPSRSTSVMERGALAAVATAAGVFIGVLAGRLPRPHRGVNASAPQLGARLGQLVIQRLAQEPGPKATGVFLAHIDGRVETANAQRELPFAE